MAIPYWMVGVIIVLAIVAIALVITKKIVSRGNAARVRAAANEFKNTLRRARLIFSLGGNRPEKETVIVLLMNITFMIAWMITLLVMPKWGYTMAVIQVLYTLFSLRSVGPTEQGLLLFFGKPVKEVGSGLVYTPLGILNLIVETKNNMQDELPAEPELIYHGDDPTPPEGFFMPIRITFGPRATLTDGDPSNDPAARIPVDDPYNKRLTAEVTPVITWRISSLKTFIEKVGSVENARKQMEDMAIAVFTEEFSQMTPAAALQRLNAVSKKLRNALEECVKDWGIEIVDAKIKPFGFSHALNSSVVMLSVAEQEAKQTATRAEGEKIRLTKEGEGRGLAAKAEYTGQAEGLEKMAAAANKPGGKLAMTTEAARIAYQNAKYSIIPPNNLAGLVAGAGGDIFKQGFGDGGEDNTPPPATPPQPPTPSDTIQARPVPYHPQNLTNPFAKKFKKRRGPRRQGN